MLKGLDESITAGGDAAIDDVLSTTLGTGDEIICFYLSVYLDPSLSRCVSYGMWIVD